MTTSYYLAPNYRYYVNSICGVPAVGGTIATFDAITGLPRSTYSDPAGVNPNPVVMRITADGSPGYPVYWKIVSGGTLYRVVVRDAAGSLIWEAPNYPIDSSIGSGNVINVLVNADNYFRNEQYNFWHQGTTFTNDQLPVGITQTADDWYFERTNTSATLSISRVTFPTGNTTVPANPSYGWQYEVSVPAADSKNDHFQDFKSVQSFQNTQVSVTLYGYTAVSSTTSEIILFVYQYFGSAGSTPVETVIQTFTLSDTPTIQPITFTMPSIAGLTIDPNGGDFVRIGYRMNPNLIQTIIFADMQFQNGVGTGINYPFRTVEQQFVNDIQLQLSQTQTGQGTDLIGYTNKPTYGNLTTFLDEVTPHNFLIGWDFPLNPYQTGWPINNGTTVKNNDGTYILDQTILISDGDNVVNMTGQPGYYLTLEIVTIDRKFGIFQIIDAENSRELQSHLAIASAYAQIGFNAANLGMANARIAIVAWTGALNQEVRQVVAPGQWNGIGTNPTLASGWNYLAVADITFDGGQTNLFTVNNEVTPANAYGVMIWYDDTTTFQASDYVIFYQASLTQTQSWCYAEQLTAQQTLQLCQRYFQKSYPPSASAPFGYSLPQNNSSSYSLFNGAGANNQMGAFGAVVAVFTVPPLYNYPIGVSNAAGQPVSGESIIIVNAPTQLFNIKLKVTMEKIPSVQLYNSVNGNQNTAYCYYDLEIINPGNASAEMRCNIFNTTKGEIELISLTDIPFYVGPVSQDSIFIGPAYLTCVYIMGINISLPPNSGTTIYFNTLSNPYFSIEYIADARLGV